MRVMARIVKENEGEVCECWCGPAGHLSMVLCEFWLGAAGSM